MGSVSQNVVETSLLKASCKAVIFDMDGTLVETTEADFKAWQRIFKDHGRSLSFDDYFPLLGRKSQDVVENVLALSGADALETMQRKMHYFEEIVATTGLQLLPGADHLLKELRGSGIVVGLATSSRQPKMKLVLEKTGLSSFFHTVITGEMVERGKPSPDIFLLTASRMAVSAADCVVVEDAVHGVRAANAAGMKSVGIVSTHEKEELEEAHLVINEYSELTVDVLKGLFSVE